MPDRTVYVDESFFEWFGLPNEDSNFCYAAVSLPVQRKDQLVSFMEAFRRQLLKYCEIDNGKPITTREVKSKLLYSISKEHREILAEKLKYFLKKNQGYLFSFFTTSKGFIHNRIRDKYYEEYGKHYNDFISNVDDEVISMKNELIDTWKKEPYNIALLEPLYIYLTSFLLHFHQARGETFKIQYDPREKGEDIILNTRVHDSLGLIEKVFFQLENNEKQRFFSGYNANISSDDCPGLQLVDLIAADVRKLFRTVLGLCEDGSETRILSAIYNPEMTPICGAPYYRRRLRDSTLKELEAVDLLFPRIRLFFAKSAISCYAKFGEARHIDIINGDVYDMAD